MLTSEQKQSYTKDGYLIIEKRVPKVLVEEIVHELKIFAKQVSGEIFPSEEEIWTDPDVVNIPPCKTITTKFLNLSEVIEPVQEIIGYDISLLYASPILIRPGQGKIYWHRDFRDVLNYLLSSVSKSADGLTDTDLQLLLPAFLKTTLFLNIFLQDMSDAVGPVRVIPGSHKWEHSPEQRYANLLPGEVRLLVPAGAAIFFEPSTWHTLDANTSTIDCWMYGFFFAKKNIQSVLDALEGKI